MGVEAFAKTRVGGLWIRFLGSAMESRLRYRFFAPTKILSGADLHPGQTVLEVGCGTGFFTLPAARLVGDAGCLVAMDILPASVAFVANRVRAAELRHVQVVSGDALATNLDAASFDVVLLFGVVPAPMLPLGRILREMHRVLKPQGVLAVWPRFPGMQRAIVSSGRFAFSSERNGVQNFRRVDGATP